MLDCLAVFPFLALSFCAAPCCAEPTWASRAESKATPAAAIIHLLRMNPLPVSLALDQLELDRGCRALVHCRRRGLILEWLPVVAIHPGIGSGYRNRGDLRAGRRVAVRVPDHSGNIACGRSDLPRFDFGCRAGWHFVRQTRRLHVAPPAGLRWRQLRDNLTRQFGKRVAIPARE